MPRVWFVEHEFDELELELEAITEGDKSIEDVADTLLELDEDEDEDERTETAKDVDLDEASIITVCTKAVLLQDFVLQSKVDLFS